MRSFKYLNWFYYWSNVLLSCTGNNDMNSECIPATHPLITYMENNTEFFTSERFVGEVFMIRLRGQKNWNMSVRIRHVSILRWSLGLLWRPSFSQHQTSAWLPIPDPFKQVIVNWSTCHSPDRHWIARFLKSTYIDTLAASISP